MPCSIPPRILRRVTTLAQARARTRTRAQTLSTHRRRDGGTRSRLAGITTCLAPGISINVRPSPHLDFAGAWSWFVCAKHARILVMVFVLEIEVEDVRCR